MRSVRTVLIVMVFSVGIWFTPPVFGGGLEGSGVTDDCDCLAMCDEPDVKKTGPYLKGTFTISLADYITPYPDRFHIHLFLRWGNRIFLRNLITTTEGYTPCELTEEIIKKEVLANALLCLAQVEEAFGLVGTPLVKELIITDKGGCDESPTDDDIIRGEITISVVPTVTCDIPPTCYD